MIAKWHFVLDASRTFDLASFFTTTKALSKYLADYKLQNKLFQSKNIEPGITPLQQCGFRQCLPFSFK